MCSPIRLFRTYMRTGDIKRWETVKPAAGVSCQEGVAYMDDGNPLHTLNIYRAEAAEGKQPLVVDVHGGSWIYGDRTLNRNYDHYVALKGYTVMALGYRYTPETNFAGQVQDLLHAFNWIKAHGEEYGCDMDNVYLCGDSSGAHISSLALWSMADPDVAALFGVDCDLHFNAVNFTCGAFYLGEMCDKGWYARLFFGKIIGKGYRKNPAFARANFEPQAGLALPPMCFNSCYGDFMRDNVAKAYDHCNTVGYTCQLVFREAQTEHPLGHVFNIQYPDWDESRETNDAMLAWFEKYKK